MRTTFATYSMGNMAPVPKSSVTPSIAMVAVASIHVL